MEQPIPDAQQEASGRQQDSQPKEPEATKDRTRNRMRVMATVTWRWVGKGECPSLLIFGAQWIVYDCTILLLSAKSLSETLNFWAKYIKMSCILVVQSPKKAVAFDVESRCFWRWKHARTFRGSSRSWRKLRNLRLSRPFCLLWIGETWSAGIHFYIFARSSEYFLLEETWRNILFADHEQPKRI